MAGGHFHLLTRMHLGSEYTDEEIKERYKKFFEGGEDEEDNKDRELTDGQVAFYRAKWEDLSEFVKDIKQGFSRFYNKRHNRRGFFWSERFRSVIVDPPDSPDNSCTCQEFHLSNTSIHPRYKAGFKLTWRAGPPDSPDNRDEYVIRHASCIEISLPHKVQCTARAAGG